MKVWPLALSLMPCISLARVLSTGQIPIAPHPHPSADPTTVASRASEKLALAPEQV